MSEEVVPGGEEKPVKPPEVELLLDAIARKKAAEKDIDSYRPTVLKFCAAYGSTPEVDYTTYEQTKPHDDKILDWVKNILPRQMVDVLLKALLDSHERLLALEEPSELRTSTFQALLNSTAQQLLNVHLAGEVVKESLNFAAFETLVKSGRIDIDLMPDTCFTVTTIQKLTPVTGKEKK